MMPIANCVRLSITPWCVILISESLLFFLMSKIAVFEHRLLLFVIGDTLYLGRRG